MPIHLFNLFARSFAAIPSALGSTWLGMLFPVLIALVGEIIGVALFGVRPMIQNWKKATGIGFAALGAGYTLLFLWCLITTTYGDHVGLVNDRHSLRQQLGQSDQREKDKVQSVRTELGSQLTSVKENCAKIEGANGALVKQTSDQQGTINNCQTQALKLLTPEAMKITPLVLEPPNGGGLGVQNAKWLLIVNKTVTPVNLAVICQRRFISGSASIVGSGGTMAGGTSRVTDTQYEVTISFPAWGPESPLIFTMSYYGSPDNPCSFIQR